MASDRNTRWAHRLIPLLLFTMGLADGGWSGEGRGNLVREVFQVKAPKDKPSLVFSEASQLRVALHQSAPPKADGVLNDACWSTASAVALLDGGARPLASEPSAALLYFGADALHIAFICPLAAGTEELSESRRRDHLVWKDESIEVFVDPGRTRERYYQFILNTLNTQQDGEGWQGKWSGEWRSGAVVTGQPSGGKGLPEALKARKDLAFIRGAKRFWACELSIPYAIIGATRPKVGDIWGLNLCRNDKRRGEGRVWSRIKRSNHEPSSFGEIRFVDEAPLARIGPYWNAPAPVTGNNVFRFFVAGGSARAGEFEVRARLSRPGGQEQALPVRTAAVNRMASLAIPLQQVGRYRLALALKDTKSGKVVAEKSMLFDLSPPPRALRVKLDQKVYYASEKVLCADVVLGENTGAKYGEVAFRLCGDDGKPLRQGKVAAPSKAFQVEMDIRGLAPGKYSLSTTFSGKAAVRRFGVTLGPFDTTAAK